MGRKKKVIYVNLDDLIVFTAFDVVQDLKKNDREIYGVLYEGEFHFLYRRLNYFFDVTNAETNRTTLDEIMETYRFEDLYILDQPRVDHIDFLAEDMYSHFRLKDKK